MTNLVIVESPAKAKTIAKYLGPGYDVIASFGHIRELPSKNGSVDTNNDFAINYEISPKSTKHVRDIVTKAKTCTKLILAPDPDREGESIAWHVLEVLKNKKAIKSTIPVERVVFNSITKSAVSDAIKNPRQINMDLVNAQQARRALDYLVGFTLSPVLWRKLPGSKSAGRVQSVSLRLICDREDEIDKFVSREYWSIKLSLNNQDHEQFEANLIEVNGKKLEKFSIQNKDQAEIIKDKLKEKQYQIAKITKKEVKRRPQPPFTTSSMQQEAARKLGFSAKKTMMVAQKLYEGIDIGGSTQGLITYMRTDSIEVAPEGLKNARSAIEILYGKKYLPKQPNHFKSKVKNAQEAHESIRPTDFSLNPDKIRNNLDQDQFSLYDLIWKRMMASQMSDAIFDQVVIDIVTIPSYGKARTVGTTIKFDGFYKVYREDRDDEKEEDKQNLPKLSEDENLSLNEVRPNQHFTEPPPRYSEASLIKKMEELGIGRPSTYATIISVIQDRGYVRIDKKRFFPEERGRIVTTFLKEFFAKYVEYSYTADLENELDYISNGDIEWNHFLAKFWKDFSSDTTQVSEKSFQEVLDVLNEKVGEHVFGRDDTGKINDSCASCKDGKLSLRLGKFGSFIGCSNYPDCKNSRKIFIDEASETSGDNKSGFEPRNIGADPATGLEMQVKLGPYGPYIELLGSEIAAGEEIVNGKKKKIRAKKPKRVAIPKGINPSEIDSKVAAKLLTLPREVGLHPENGEKILASIGPFGPYLLYDKQFFSVKDDDILEIGLNRSVDLIATLIEKKKHAPKRPKRKYPIKKKSKK